MTIEELVTELDALVTKAKEDGDRPLSVDEVARYEDLEVELKSRQKTQELRLRSEAYKSVQPGVVVTSTVKSDDVVERAFENYIRTGIADANVIERAQSVGTNSAGGYLVPETFRQKLVERRKSFGGVANEVEEFTTTGGNPMPFPTLDDTSNAGVIAAEGTAPASGGADLVFGEKILGAYKYVAPGASNLPLRVSVELLQDSAFDVQGLVRNKLSERIARKQATDWVNGDGSGKPAGLATSTGPSNTFTAAAPTYADLVTAKHTVDPEYRDGAVWTFNDAFLATLEGLVDGNGRPLLSQSTDGISGEPALMLLGYRVVIDQAWASYTDGTTNVFGAFGNLREGYVIRRVQDVTLIVNPYTRANEGQVEYTLWARADGIVQNPYAFSLLKNAV